MDIHEYQAKEILSRNGVKVQEGLVASSVAEALEAAKKLSADQDNFGVVVKAQIHAGGRGKGGGVKFAPSLDAVKEKADAILGMQLVTPQTSAEGKLVQKVLITKDAYYKGEVEPKEYYISILLDRETSQDVIIYTTEGGMDIEEVAEKTPEKLHKEFITPGMDLQGYQARRIAFNLNLDGKAHKEMVRFVTSLYQAYKESDASLIEINPALRTSDNQVMAVDAKMSLDDNALYRHNDLMEYRDLSEEDELEVEAKKHNLNYVRLDGNVGCMVNGAGLAMATMDMIKLSGGEPANFLDVGGTANAETVEAAFRLILQDSNVEAILVNIFGGIVRCDRVAQGIVDAYNNIGDIPVPIIVRLQGTNAEEAKKIIDESGLKVHSAIALSEAAEKVKSVLNS